MKNAGITELDPYAWRLVRASEGALYLILARANQGSTARRTAAERSTSPSMGRALGETAPSEGTNGPNGLALDPRDNRRMYLAAWGLEREGGSTGGGVFLSRRRIELDDHLRPGATCLRCDRRPESADTLYICGFDADASGRPMPAFIGRVFALQLHLGPSRDDGSQRRREDLHHHLWRKRVAWTGGRRPQRN